MRAFPRFALAGLLLVAVPAAAETPYNCHPGFSPRVQISADRTKLRFGAKLDTPAGFDPAANGLDIVVSYEPETDPSRVIFSAGLPKSGFEVVPGGLRYQDRAGTVGGVTYVLLVGPVGAQKVKIRRTGAALAGPLAEGALRVVLSSGVGACVRTCGSPAGSRGPIVWSATRSVPPRCAACARAASCWRPSTAVAPVAGACSRIRPRCSRATTPRR